MNDTNSQNGCESVRPLLSPYIDAQVSVEEAALVESHLATCEACQRELAQLRVVVAGLQALPEMAPPRSFAIPAAIPLPVTVFPPRHLTYLRGFAAALAACLVLVLGLNTYLSATMPGAPATTVSEGSPRIAAEPQQARDGEAFGALAATAEPTSDGASELTAPAPAAAQAPQAPEAATPVPAAGASQAPPAAAPVAPRASPEPSPAAERLLTTEPTALAEPTAPAASVAGAGEQKNAAEGSSAPEADVSARQAVPAEVDGLWVTALGLALALMLSLVAIANGSRGPRAP